MVFQGSQTLVHKLHDKQLETFQLFLSCFVKAEYITKGSVMVFEEKMLLSAREMYVGREADGFRTRNPNHALLKSFMEQVTKAYTTTALYMQNKLPLQGHTQVIVCSGPDFERPLHPVEEAECNVGPPLTSRQ